MVVGKEKENNLSVTLSHILSKGGVGVIKSCCHHCSSVWLVEKIVTEKRLTYGPRDIVNIFWPFFFPFSSTFLFPFYSHCKPVVRVGSGMVVAWWVVFKGPVHAIKKDQKPNWTRPFRTGPVVMVACFQTTQPDWFGMVAHVIPLKNAHILSLF